MPLEIGFGRGHPMEKLENTIVWPPKAYENMSTMHDFQIRKYITNAYIVYIL